MKKYKGKLQVGSVEGKEWKEGEKPAAPAPEKGGSEVKARVLEPENNPGAVAPQPGGAAVEYAPSSKEALDQFGDMVPFADPSWYQGVRGIAFKTCGISLTSITVPIALLQPVARGSSR